MTFTKFEVSQFNIRFFLETRTTDSNFKIQGKQKEQKSRGKEEIN